MKLITAKTSCYTCRNGNKGFWSTILVGAIGLTGIISFSVHKHLQEKNDRFQMVLNKLGESSAEVGRLKAIIKNFEKKVSEGEEKEEKK